MPAMLSPDMEAATAILDRCRRVLTGAEEALCEDVASGEFEQFETTLSNHWMDDDDDDDGEPGTSDITKDRQRFESLKIQFSREIGEWRDGKGGVR